MGKQFVENINLNSRFWYDLTKYFFLVHLYDNSLMQSWIIDHFRKMIISISLYLVIKYLHIEQFKYNRTMLSSKKTNAYTQTYKNYLTFFFPKSIRIYTYEQLSFDFYYSPSKEEKKVFFSLSLSRLNASSCNRYILISLSLFFLNTSSCMCVCIRIDLKK